MASLLDMSTPQPPDVTTPPDVRILVPMHNARPIEQVKQRRFVLPEVNEIRQEILELRKFVRPEEVEQIRGEMAELRKDLTGQVSEIRATLDALNGVVEQFTNGGGVGGQRGSTHEEAEAQIEAHAQMYKLRESLWDLMLVVDIKEMSTIEIVCTVVMILGHTCLFLVFLAMVYLHFGDYDFGEESAKDYERWRVQDGHSFPNVVNNMTLVERACRLDKSLSFGGPQMAAIEAIGQYLGLDASDALGGDRGGALLTGTGMAIAAVGVWLLVVARELRQIWEFSLALLCLPWSRDRAHIQGFVVESIHPMHLLMLW
eukprot:TRINITY_DN68648_c0_g1_i1.p1 TRINITY_DN68648_c0_g1~~TRINITY_DN68648_c0_g1_i1.p1  ORF type:complete len:315 (+),score=35.79 TRINITY_DN68648_c0_g1_i1:178-1122(+)